MEQASVVTEGTVSVSIQPEIITCLTKGMVTKCFPAPPQNHKESDQSHLGNLNYILCGHFEKKKKMGVYPSGWGNNEAFKDGR